MYLLACEVMAYLCSCRYMMSDIETHNKGVSELSARTDNAQLTFGKHDSHEAETCEVSAWMR